MPDPTPRVRSTPFLLAALTALGLHGSVPAQERVEPQPGERSQATTPPDLDTLLKALTAAHAPEADPAAAASTPDRFRARLVLSQIRGRAPAAQPTKDASGSKTEQGGDDAKKDPANVDVELRASFVRPRFMSYSVEERGVKLARGLDADGRWVRKDDQITDLEGADARDYGTERDLILQHVRLANQLLRFLDPAAEIRKLEDIEGPAPDKLPIRRLADQQHWRVAGSSKSFPMYTTAGKTSEALVELWIDAATNRLAALRATEVLGKDAETGERRLGRGEFILLDDLQATSNGRLVPRVLRVRPVDHQGRPVGAAVKIEINRLELDPPDLTRESLRRPK